jgi:hypothetical protein
MQILRLLAARRAASTIIASPVSESRDDDGAFFDLDFSSGSVRASSSSSGSFAFSDSDDDECTELDFVISLQRSHSASPLFSGGGSKAEPDRKRGISTLRTLSFGARKAAPLCGRPSFARSSSARSLGLQAEDDRAQACTRAPSREDVIWRCLAKISRRIRKAASPRAADARGLRRLRKCRSAPSASSPRDDESAVEKLDGLAEAIAHCKESLHRL